MIDERANNVIAMREGIVDFGHYPNAALDEIASRYVLRGHNRQAMITKMRERLLTIDGTALVLLLQDLQGTALRHGARDVVELTVDVPSIGT